MAVKKQFSSFEAMLQAAEKPVLVDFYATWCGPCQIMGKTLEEISPQMANEIQIVKVDGDRYPALASTTVSMPIPPSCSTTKDN